MMVVSCGVKRHRAILACMAVNLLFIGFGALAAYPSPAIPNLNEHKNPFHVDNEEISWLGSFMSLGFIAGSLVCGIMNDIFGRRLTMILAALGTVIGFTVVAASLNVQLMYAGFFVAGAFGCICTVAAQVYVAEVAPSEIRGVLFTMFNLFMACGNLFVYVAGAFLAWNWLSIVVAFLFTFPLVALLYSAESPRWLLFSGNKEAAVFSLKWLRGEHSNWEEELKVIEDGLHSESKNRNLIAWKNLFTWSVMKPLLLCIYLLFVQNFCGGPTIQVFSVIIFQLAGVSLDPYKQTIVIGAVAVVGSIVCMFAIETFGRRVLMMVSCLLMTLSMSAIGVYFRIFEVDAAFAGSQLSWLPVVAFSIGSFAFYLGINPIPWLFSCELFPTDVRGAIQTAVNVGSALMLFASLKIFFNLINALQISGTFWLYGAVSASGLFVSIFLIPHKSQDVME